MVNKFRNEMEVKLGEVSIVLRPTFENIAALETNVGGISYLAWKFSRGLTELKTKDKLTADAISNSEKTVKSLPSMSEISQIIYYCQAAHDPEENKKAYTLKEVFNMVMSSGSGLLLSSMMTVFIGKMLAGDNFDENKVLSEAEKKS